MKQKLIVIGVGILTLLSIVYGAGTTVNGTRVINGDLTVKGTCTGCGGGGITIGSTTVTSGTSGYYLYNNAGVVGNTAASPSNTGCPATTTTVAGWVCLETHSGATSNELDFTTCLVASGFDEFKLVFDKIVPTADGADVALEVSTDGGMTYDTSTSNYAWGAFRWTDNNASGTNGTRSFAYVDISGFGQIKADSTYGFNGEFTVQGVTSSSVKKPMYGQGTWYDSGANQNIMGSMMGWYLQSTAVNAFRIYMQTHNIAAYTQATTIASGTVRCYGVQH